MVRAHLFIRGDVIGVGFRFWTVTQAQKLGLTGWVRNVYESNKGVEAVFEGEEDKVKQMIEFCRKGPEIAWVEKVEVKWEEATGEFNNFIILR